LSSCGWRRSSSFQGRCRGRVQSWCEGRRPTLRALPRTLLMPGIKEVQRSPVLESILAMEVDSTAELPSAPDPGSVGSSSCVSNFARYMSVRSTFVVLTESSNFNTATPHGPSLRDELSGSEGETGESMECVLHRRRRAVCKGAVWAFNPSACITCQTRGPSSFVTAARAAASHGAFVRSQRCQAVSPPRRWNFRGHFHWVI
jgi:hypothetical protein